jgi:hypothetical protein
MVRGGTGGSTSAFSYREPARVLLECAPSCMPVPFTLKMPAVSTLFSCSVISEQSQRSCICRSPTPLSRWNTERGSARAHQWRRR